MLSLEDKLIFYVRKVENMGSRLESTGSDSASGWGEGGVVSRETLAARYGSFGTVVDDYIYDYVTSVPSPDGGLKTSETVEKEYSDLVGFLSLCIALGGYVKTPF